MDASAGLREYRRRAVTASACGVVALAVGGLLLGSLGQVARAAVVVGAIVVVLGSVGLVRTIRVGRMASKQGWRKRIARFKVVGRGNGQPALLLVADSNEPEAVLSLSTTVFRWGALEGIGWLWVTGDPQSRFAAVATPDGAHVIVVKRPILPSWRNRLRGIATGT